MKACIKHRNTNSLIVARQYLKGNVVLEKLIGGG
jgi:hypothetical protein